jgi:hypothetical protein
MLRIGLVGCFSVAQKEETKGGKGVMVSEGEPHNRDQ